jgi:hypothetical protein
MSERAADLIERWLVPYMENGGFAHVGPGVFERSPGDSDVRQIVYVFENPKWDYLLNADLGIRNDRAEEFSCDSIRTFGGALFEQFRCGGPIDCTMRFSLAGMNPGVWPIAIDGISSSSFAEGFTAFLNEELMGMSRSVVSIEQFFSFLVEDHPFSSWLACNSAIRAAQIVAVGSQLGFDHAEIRAILEPRRTLIANGGGKLSMIRADPVAYIEELLQRWSKVMA